MNTNHLYSSGWRDHTKALRHALHAKRLLKRTPLLILCSGSLLVGLIFLFFGAPWTSEQVSQAGNSPSGVEKKPVAIPERPAKKPVSIKIGDLNLDSAHSVDRFVLERAGGSIIVESSLDPGLQKYIIGLLQNSKTLKAAVVVLRPDDGRVLAMVSYDKEGNDESLCLKADFPAASLFKIVSAAAALENAGFTPEQTVYFEGYKHTLYKRQLKQNKGRHASKVSFKRAFGSSINPVFGKLGIYDLGQKVMADSAEKFFFNRSIPFDFPVSKSIVKVPDDDFGLAEISSGFNKDTVISPLHAALLASAVANNGVMMKPWLVKRVLKQDGEVLYQRSPEEMSHSISKETAEGLKILMKETVLHGTCRKSFRRLRRKKAFKGVELGAKTGTINDRTDQFKYDWVTAYVLPPGGAKGFCIAVLGVHGDKLGVRAGHLGRYIINYYLSS